MPPPIQSPWPDGRKKHVTHEEYKAIRLAAMSLGRYQHRDGLLIMLAFNHGLRCKELVNLDWQQINLFEKTIHVTRAKNGSPGTHPLSKDEVKALQKHFKATGPRGFVFLTERGGPLSTSTFTKLLARAGEAAKMPIRIHPHMLRHGCGYFFANKGKDTRSLQGYLGHKNIQNTVKYTALSKDRFKDFDTEG